MLAHLRLTTPRGTLAADLDPKGITTLRGPTEEEAAELLRIERDTADREAEERRAPAGDDDGMA